MLKIISKEQVAISAVTPDRSLFLLPGTPKDVTEVELEAIKEQNPNSLIMVLPGPVKRQVAKPERHKVASDELAPEDLALEGPGLEPESEDSEAIALIKKSVTNIINELDEKERLMDSDEYKALLKELLDLEEAGEINRESPRVTLIRHLEGKLEQ